MESLERRKNVVLAAKPLAEDSVWRPASVNGELVIRFVALVTAHFTREECERDPWLANNPDVMRALVELDRAGGGE